MDLRLDRRIDRKLDEKSDLKEMLSLEGGLDLDCLGMFCEKFNVRFVRADMTYERGFSEPIYFFSDNLGGYTIEALKGSI